MALSNCLIFYALYFLAMMVLPTHLKAANDIEGLTSICGPYYLEKDRFINTFNFGPNEKILICGSETSGWQNIPKGQALYQVGVFLENKGYFNWSYQVRDKKIIISRGDRSYVEKNNFIGAPENFIKDSYKGLRGRPMTPDLIEEAKNWTLKRMRALGFPCAKVMARAFVKQKALQIEIELGRKYLIGEIKIIGDLALDKKAMSRFYAIK